MLEITATDLPRLLACNGSRLMDEFKSSIDVTNTVRDEGNAAHWLIEKIHRNDHLIEELIDRPAKNGIYITEEMVDHVRPYLDAIGKNGLIEHSTQITTFDDRWIVNSRADSINLDNRILKIGDFKYGYSIIEPEENWTLIAHAIGYCIQLTHNSNFSVDKDLDRIDFTIYQPRGYHYKGKIRTWSITPQQLISYNQELIRKLDALSNELVTGKHCKNCSRNVYCPAARKSDMNALDVSEIAFNDTVDDKQLSYLLNNFKIAIEVLERSHKAFGELALHRIKQGKIIDGYAAERELTNRVWRDFVTPEIAHMITGTDVTKKDLITPSQAEKKGISKEILDSLTERRVKGLKLIKSDANKQASKLFDNFNPTKGN